MMTIKNVTNEMQTIEKQSSRYLALTIEFRSVKCPATLTLSIARKPTSRSLTFSSIVSGTFYATSGSI